MDNTLLLIDGSSFIFRAYHAMPNLTSPSGKPTGAIYGIINMLKQMQKKYSTKYWACVFDTKGETFRDKIYPQYKANRTATPFELLEQLEDIYKIIAALGIPVIMQAGVEADDIIGTLALKAKHSGQKVLIATGDKDFAQLVDEDIILINTMTDEKLDRHGVINKFGVVPEQIIDYLSLIGDKVDNIPGVDKCGPKTAAKWLTEYTSLDNLIENQNKLSGVVGENFRQAIQWLNMAKTLVTIDTNVDLSVIYPNGYILPELSSPEPNTLHESYARLGFKTWLRQLSEENADFKNAAELTTQTESDLTESIKPAVTKLAQIKNESELKQIINQLINQNQTIGLVCIPNNIDNPTHLISTVISSQSTTYIINEPETNSNDLFNNTPHVTYLTCLIELFTSKIAKVLPNYKETLHYLSQLGISLENVVGDVTLAHYIKNSKQNHLLSNIYQLYLNLDVIDSTKLSKIDDHALKQQSYINLSANAVSLEQFIRKSLDSQELKLYLDIELPLVNVLTKMENDGIKLDISGFQLLEQELSSQLKVLEDKIYLASGSVFNIGSPKQLQDILFKQMKLSVTGIKKNATGYSTDEDNLKTLEEQGIFIATLLLEYRMLSKLLNTYVTKLPKVADSNGKVHTTFDQALVASGRLSSKEPNLQNIPVRNDWGRRIRKCFIAAKDHVLVCADYSQIELRILAHFSGDENLINAFNTNQDIHSITASEVFSKPIADISKDERRYAKIINFSLLYGKTVFGLAQELHIDRTTAKNYIDAYFAKYPKIKACLENIKEQSRQNGYIATVFGRRIYLPNIKASNRIIREAEERLALNAPMQGTSADIIKIAMNNIANWLKANNLYSQMVLQVHDELIFQVPFSEVELIQNNLANLMTQDINLKVKLGVDIKVASNWDDAH